MRLFAWFGGVGVSYEDDIASCSRDAITANVSRAFASTDHIQH